MTGPRKTDEQVLADHTVADPSGCTLWTGAQNKGYGKVLRDGTTWGAHRFSWTLANGPIPEGMVIDHLCRTPLCVNPEHMEVTTIRENTLRGLSFAAANHAKTHCKRGHELAAGNVYAYPGRQSRECVTCKRLHQIARRRGMTLAQMLGEEVAA